MLAGLALVVMRGRLRRGQAKAAALGLIVLPLVLLTPAVNQSQPLSAFSLEGTSIVSTLRGQTPGQVLTINEPFYSGFPTTTGGRWRPGPAYMSTHRNSACRSGWRPPSN
ncbi:MAG: hypothetical protein WKF78_07435 [Candidatus Limnocylindrales bacterium]